LKGNLGAGKTTFVQGFFRGLGLKKRAPSPTFIIVRRHSLPRGLKKRKLTNVFHADAYRLKNAKHLAALGFKETLADPKNIVLIEWPERAKGILPMGTIWLTFKHGKRENERHIMIKR
jgi:tRNA threonylcarbamoyladenosine biosynthesis protein TsaE